MSDSSSSDGEDSWIQWFCGLEGHEMFCEIDRGYIEDAFNLYGLRHFVPRINDSLDLILDRTAQNEASHELMEATCALYGLIHARYVLTAAGLEAMYAKYTLQEFGNCPHFLCKRQSVVPLGVRDEPHIETVKLYCPKCQNVYVHPSHAAQRVDGAYFGTTFPHLFFMTYGTLVPDPLDKTFVPRVFGFRVHSTAPNGASASGDRHDQRLQERKRLRRASLPPPKEPGGAGEGGTGVAPAAGGAVAGEVASGGGKGKGRAKEGADAGGGRNGVVVRIKEEEGSWSTGGGGREKGIGAAAGEGPETVAGGAEVEGAGCRKDASSGRRSGASERMEDGGDRHGSSHGAENGRETSPTVSLQHSGTPTEGKDPVESNCVTIATPQRSDGGNAENGGARCSSHDRDAADADARAAATTKTDGINNSESLRRDACGVGRGNRSGDGAAQASAAAAAAAAATAAAAAAAPAESSSKSDVPQKDRGKKRSSEVELETELSREADGGGGGGGGDGGGGAGEAGEGGAGGGAGGRTRGKVLRGGRNHASPAARGVSSLTSAAPATNAMAVKGGVVGSPGGRRIGQGRSPV